MVLLPISHAPVHVHVCVLCWCVLVSHVATLYRFVNDDFMRFGWDDRCLFEFFSVISSVCVCFAVAGSTVIGCLCFSFCSSFSYNLTVWQNRLNSQMVLHRFGYCFVTACVRERWIMSSWHWHCASGPLLCFISATASAAVAAIVG